MTAIEPLLARAAAITPEAHPFGEIRWLVSGSLDAAATMTLGVCRIDPGRSNPLHYHPNCEEVLYVVSGRCRKTVGAESVEMGPGDCIRIPRGKVHQAEALGTEPFVCVIAYDTPDRQVVFLR